MEIFELLPDQLYQSPAIDDWQLVLDRGITAVVALNGLDNHTDTLQLGFSYLLHPIEDGALPDMDELGMLAAFGVMHLRHGGKLLAHCAAGINRASLYNAMVLRLIGTAKGQDLVDYIRAHRPGALSNQVFADYLIKLN